MCAVGVCSHPPIARPPLHHVTSVLSTEGRGRAARGWERSHACRSRKGLRWAPRLACPASSRSATTTTTVANAPTRPRQPRVCGGQRQRLVLPRTRKRPPKPTPLLPERRAAHPLRSRCRACCTRQRNASPPQRAAEAATAMESMGPRAWPESTSWPVRTRVGRIRVVKTGAVSTASRGRRAHSTALGCRRAPQGWREAGVCVCVPGMRMRGASSARS